MSWKSRSYAMLPALSIRRRALRSALRLVTLAWMFGVVWVSLVNGSHVKVFCRMIGFDDFAFGVLGAIPFVATFGQLIAAVIIERSGLRKYHFLHTATLHRLSWLAIAVIPLLLPVPSALAVVWMLLVLSVSWFLAALSAPAWLTWMGDLIPRRIRGRFLASRERRAMIIQAVVVMLAGFWMDAVYNRALPETPQAQPSVLGVVAVLFLVAAVFGAVDILLFLRVREVLPQKPSRPILDFDVPRPPPWRVFRLADWAGRYAMAMVRQILLDPLRDRTFRHYVLYGATVIFSATVGNWYFWLNAMDNLGFSKMAANFLFMVVGPVSATFAAGFWGRLIDRYGKRPTLILATLGAVFSVIPWMIATRDMPLPGFFTDAVNVIPWLAGLATGHEGWAWLAPGAPYGAYVLGGIGCVFGGTCWLGIGLAQTGIMLGFSDSGGRSQFVAACGVLVNLGGALGGIVGGIIAQSLTHLQADPLRVGPWLWNNWHMTFVAAILTRTGSIFWLVGMPEPGSRRVIDILRQISSNVYNNAATMLLYPVRILGWRPKDEGNHHGGEKGPP